jgi:ketosteroid isomerase-like protein
MKNKEIVKQVVEAFLEADVEKALSHMTEGVQMGWPGFFDLAPGKEAIREFMKNVPEMTSDGIEDLIEDGDKVAATGSVVSRHEDGKIKKSFFCDVYHLDNGKIKAIKSYMVFEQPGK